MTIARRMNKARVGHKAITLYAIIVIGALFAPSARAESPNEKLVKFCQANLGQKVGGGECADLANNALLAAGAKPQRAYPDAPKEGDYVWGKLVASVEVTKGGRKVEGKLADAQAGDIIQYRDAAFKGNLQGRKYTSKATHHTAVLMAIAANGRDLKVCEQNRSGKKIVSIAEVRLGDLKEGWVRIYQPEAGWGE